MRPEETRAVIGFIRPEKSGLDKSSPYRWRKDARRNCEEIKNENGHECYSA